MLITGKEISDTCLEMIRILGFSSIRRYIYSEGSFPQDIDFENDQKYFDCVYSPDPDILLNLKLKIPYFYDIPSGLFDYELNFKVFNRIYSQLGGAKAVFVNDKKMSRYAHWEGLNTYWINEGIDLEKDFYAPKKFITPKLHIGYIYDNEENYQIIKNVYFARKSNWIFHLYNPYDLKLGIDTVLYEGNIDLRRYDLYRNCHVLLNPSMPHKHSIRPVPSQAALEAMYQGCILVSGNMHDNGDHLIFDKYHYLKLDFIDANTVIETLRYADKRREKLERMSKSGREVIFKYYDVKESARQKIKIILSLIR